MVEALRRMTSRALERRTCVSDQHPDYPVAREIVTVRWRAR